MVVYNSLKVKSVAPDIHRSELEVKFELLLCDITNINLQLIMWLLSEYFMKLLV